MSYWVTLQDHTAAPWCSYGVAALDFQPQYGGDEPCPEPCYPAVEVPAHREGGTYAIGGTCEASLNITYNYSRHYHGLLGADGLRGMDGKLAGDVLPALEAAVTALGTERASDYWAATPGNAGYALSILRDWARLYPEAVFVVH